MSRVLKRVSALLILTWTICFPKCIQQHRYLWVLDKLETLLNRFKDEEIHTEKVSDKVSVTEVDEFEPPCKKFKKRIGNTESRIL